MIVTHKVGLLAGADLVLMLEGGSLLGAGPADEILAQIAGYALAAAFFGVAGAWAAVVRLDRAVISPGASSRRRAARSSSTSRAAWSRRCS